VRRLLRRTKGTSLRLVTATGFNEMVLGSAWRRRRLAILGLHGVSQFDEHLWEPSLYHSQAVLEDRLRALRRLDCTVLPLGEAMRRLREGSLPARAVVLTFDDGNRDFADIIWPMLRRYGMPATLYVSTYYVEQRARVFNTCVRYLLWRARDRRVALPELTGNKRDWNLASATERDELFWVILRGLNARDASGAARDDALRLVEERVGMAGIVPPDRGLFELLDVGQLASLVDDGADIQLHTHRHRFPPGDAQVADEITRNRDVLARAGARPSHFAYPAGEYRPSALPLLRALGVESGVTCEPGLAHAGSDPLMLPRFVDADNIPSAEFETMLSGVRAWLPSAPIHARLPRRSA
jgi:peptidoglycan/xylan/chitin deacetylase (PgdA/CDA1 family)